MPVSTQFLEYVEDIRNRFYYNTPFSIDQKWQDLTNYWYADAMYAYRLAEDTILELAHRKGVTVNVILDSIKDTHERKNAGYAGLSSDPFANFRHATAFNVTAHQGCLVRMSDKYHRYVNLRANPELDKVQESIEDTLLDLASYAIIAQVLKDEESNLC